LSLMHALGSIIRMPLVRADVPSYVFVTGDRSPREGCSINTSWLFFPDPLLEVLVCISLLSRDSQVAQDLLRPALLSRLQPSGSPHHSSRLVSKKRIFLGKIMFPRLTSSPTQPSLRASDPPPHCKALKGSFLGDDIEVEA